MSAHTSHEMDAGYVMSSYIQHIATGPEMSKYLSLEDARMGMQLILEGKAHPIQAAVFLIALRMKRESDEEYRGILEAIRSSTRFSIAQVDDLIDIADPYDGFLRHLPASPFLPAVLAACGAPSVSHGVECIGPKYGITHRQILGAAGVNVDITPQQAAARISDPGIGWAYIDQRFYNPALYGLAGLRNLIVKRSCITTVEVMSGPVRAQGRTHLINGYVHGNYKRIYIDLARHAGYHSALIIKGIEGGIVPLLNKEVNCISYVDNNNEEECTLNPSQCGISSGQKAAPLPEALAKSDGARPDEAGRSQLQRVAKEAAREGLKALQGTPGLTRDSLVYAASACLKHIKRFDAMATAACYVNEIIDSGEALTHFQAN